MKPQLLIVDDEPDIRESIKESLDIDSIDYLEAPNGADALELLKSKRISAILSDINMPVMNGIDFLRNVRSLGYTTPFVILTAHGDKFLAKDALKLGAFDFIDKPWNNSDLKKIITSSLEVGEQILFWHDDKEMQKMLVDYQNENSNISSAVLDSNIRNKN